MIEDRKREKGFREKRVRLWKTPVALEMTKANSASVSFLPPCDLFRDVYEGRLGGMNCVADFNEKEAHR